MKILILIASVVFGYGLAYGQFDPNCYYPVIGVDIDTIYGSQNNQKMGDRIINLGPMNGESYGRIGTYGLPAHEQQFTTFTSGPGFNLQKLKDVKEFPINLNYGSQHKFGHFRDTKHLDLLVYTSRSRIYWSDDAGNYDTSRYSELRSDMSEKPLTFIDYTLIDNYVAHLTSDTVEDILMMASRVTLDHHDTVYLFLFQGGKIANDTGNIAYPDSTLHLGFYDNTIRFRRGCIYDDFRGSGRVDGLFINDSADFFIYKNDPPFTMQRFADALQYDTILAKWENPSLYSLAEGYWGGIDKMLTMQAFRRHNANDHSVDFLITFETKNDSSDGLWIFRGGPEFGTKRLYIDKPDAFLWHPEHYDIGWKNTLFYNILRNCGDMTGTGNNVLYAEGAPYAGGFGFSSFFVLGDAMDDKVDMYYGAEDAGDIPDTLTADNDGMQDIIIDRSLAISERDKNKGWKQVGSIGLLRGTKKIPVKLNTVFATEERERLKSIQMYAYPNPLDQKTVLTFENCTSGVMYMDVVNGLGVSVLREEIPDVEGLQQYAADLSGLPAGAYHIRLVCPADGWSASASVIKTGAAVTPWSLDLKKMVGR